MLPPVRSFSISSSGSMIGATFSSVFVSMSVISTSCCVPPAVLPPAPELRMLSSWLSAGRGVPACVVNRLASPSGAMASSWFSFPPAFDGTGRFLSLPALEVRRSGVAEPGLESARDLGPFVVVTLLEVAALDGGALLVTVVFFFSGFSGAGHSTS